MIPASLPPNETLRVATLRELGVLDTPIEERFERLTRLARRLLGVPIAAISLVDSDRQWFKSIQGLEATQTSRDISFCAHTILDDDLHEVMDAANDPRFRGNPLVTGDPHIAFYAGCPIKAANGTAIGALCVIDRKPRRISREDRQVLRDLAMLAETELREAMSGQVQMDLLRQLTEERRAAMVDPLTRLWNRDGLSHVLEPQLAKVEAGETSLALLMIDLDHFKAVNDQYGHLAGDEVLRQVARRMLGSVRGDDLIARYGGEEFVVLLSNPASQMTALRIAERLRTRIGDGPIRVSELAVAITASVGMVYLPAGTAANSDHALRVADEALLKAKRTGRNRMVYAGELYEGNAAWEAESISQAG